MHAHAQFWNYIHGYSNILIVTCINADVLLKKNRKMGFA